MAGRLAESLNIWAVRIASALDQQHAMTGVSELQGQRDAGWASPNDRNFRLERCSRG